MPTSFDFTQNLILEDERVLLRPLQREDALYLLPFSEQEPEIWHFSLVRAGGGIDALSHYINLAVKGREKETEFPFIVFDKKAQRYAGSTRYYDIQFGLSTLQLGYTWYGRDFQGTGLNRHCKYLLLDYAFSQLQMERVEFRADAQNARSIAAMKAIGCTVDGILRSNMPKPDGGRRDSIVLSILKAEWDSHLKENLRQKIQTT